LIASRRFRTVLLDAGGVLLDLDYALILKMLDARGYGSTRSKLSRFEALARTEIEKKVRNGGRTSAAWREYFFSILDQVGVDPAEFESMVDTLWETHIRIGLWTVAIEGGPAAVRAMKAAGYRVGVVSNAEGRVENDLYAAGYDGLLETVVDSHVVGVEKPDPEIFRIALDRLDADPAATVFAGDVPSVDVVGAQAAGIAPVLIDRHDLYPAVKAPRLRSIAELPGWLADQQL
jgi:HAD superfamily hydrolase (TIGR01549 family)